MPISDAQYTAWLRADNQRRVVLVEAEAYSAGAVVTRYMSTHGFVTTPSDTPAGTGYDDIVLDVPWVRSQLAEAFRGRSLIGYGDIDIDNSISEWMNEYLESHVSDAINNIELVVRTR
jgi:hypothetical protein